MDNQDKVTARTIDHYGVLTRWVDVNSVLQNATASAILVLIENLWEIHNQSESRL